MLKILVPLDGSDFSRQILPYLKRLFPSERCAIELLYVAQPPLPAEALAYPMAVGGDFSFYTYRGLGEASDSRHPIYEDEDLTSFRQSLEDDLRDEARAFQEAGYTITSSVHFGRPAERIISAAKEGAVDAIAMMTHGRQGLDRLISGSVAEEVVRHLALPVVLVNAVKGLKNATGERAEAETSPHKG